jgi:hypothetical protein
VVGLFDQERNRLRGLLRQKSKFQTSSNIIRLNRVTKRNQAAFDDGFYIKEIKVFVYLI